MNAGAFQLCYCIGDLPSRQQSFASQDLLKCANSDLGLYISGIILDNKCLVFLSIMGHRCLLLLGQASDHRFR